MVEPYSDRRYLVSAYMPRRYRTTGETFIAVCSWYGPGFNGRGTASGQVFNEDDYTCASRTLPFGTLLALSYGERRIIVYVNDRGPFVAGRDLDLSKAAAQALGFGGVEAVHAEVIVPAP
jgi:rare lipoprotein A